MLVAERQMHNQKDEFEDWKKETSYGTIAYNPPNCNWRCPLCKEKVIWVNEGSDGTVRHFRHKNSKSHPSISEGKKHSEAKKKIKEKISNDNQLKEIQLEKIIGEYESEYQIADIFVEKEDGEKFAVEIQISNQSVQQFKERTRFYNSKNISTLWILGREQYAPRKKTSSSPRDDTLSFKEAVKWIQRNYYGRCYFLQKDFDIVPYRLRKKKVTRDPPQYPSYEEYLDTIATYSTGNLNDYGIVSTESNGMKIGRFYDRKWWK